MNKFASLTAHIAFSTMLASPVVAQDAPQLTPSPINRPTITNNQVDIRRDFKEAISCEPILYHPYISDEQKTLGRNHLQERASEEEIISEEDVEKWVIRHFDLLGGRVPFPDLTASPSAGREVTFHLNVQDGLQHVTRSEAVTCVLPSPELFSAASLELFQLRGDMAHLVRTQSRDEFYGTTLAQLTERYRIFVDTFGAGLKKDENRESLYDLEAKFENARTAEDVGALLDEMWLTINALEKDDISKSLEKMQEIRQEIREMTRYDGTRAISQEQRQEFMQEMLEAMKEALQEQLEEAIKNGDEELQKQLEEMLEQLEEWQKMTEQMEEIQSSEFLDAYDMMRGMMQMQQNMSSSMEQMMRQMQNMQSFMQSSMRRMMESLKNQQSLDALQEMLDQQRSLMDDTAFTEEQRQDMLDQLRDTLNNYAEDLEERTHSLAEELEAERAADAEETENAQNAEVNAATERLRDIAEELKDRLSEGRESGELTPEETELLNGIEEELDKALKRMETVQTLNAPRLRNLYRSIEDAADDLNRILGDEETPEAGPTTSPEDSATQPEEQAPAPSTDDQLEEFDQDLLDMLERHNAQDAELRERQDTTKRLENIEGEIGKIREQLENPETELSEEQIQELMKQLQDFQSEIAEHQETDMNAIQNMIVQLARQLNDRVDEVGALEYLKEARARNAGDTISAQTHDDTQKTVIDLGEEVSDIQNDIIERVEKEHPLTEEEATQTITRLEEIKAVLDEIDPRPPEERSQNQQQQGENGQQQQQQPQMTPNELMQRLMEMMQRNQNKTDMQRQLEQQLQQMMEQSQELGDQQKSLEQQLEEMRQQLKDMGVPEEQINEAVEKMREAAEQLGQGKPGQSMPGQNGAMDMLNQMMQQQQMMPMPGQGSGSGPGSGPGSGSGQGEQDNFGRGVLHQNGTLDDKMMEGVSPEMQYIIDQINSGTLSPQAEEYFRGLLQQIGGGDSSAPSP